MKFAKNQCGKTITVAVYSIRGTAWNVTIQSFYLVATGAFVCCLVNWGSTDYFIMPQLRKSGDILVLACPYVCVCVCVYGGSRYRLETSCMDSSWKKS